MAYPNTKFIGMSSVTSAAITQSINDYYPNTSHRGGKKRLELLSKVTDLKDLINFCVEGYRAWGDAVLMGAGAYLKIGNYPAEIEVAKKYVKEEVYKYLTGKPFSSEADYDKWHRTICTNLSDDKVYFGEYSKYRKTSQKYDNFSNRTGFTIGNAQKFLNMLMKDLYACCSVNPSCQDYLKDYEDYFKYCHMPLDSYILRFVDDIRFREKIVKPARTYTWGNITSYTSYMDEQNDIRYYVNKYSPSVTVLQTEFVVWPLYK